MLAYLRPLLFLLIKVKFTYGEMHALSAGTPAPRRSQPFLLVSLPHLWL